jgi:hypothetical protein
MDIADAASGSRVTQCEAMDVSSELNFVYPQRVTATFNRTCDCVGRQQRDFRKAFSGWPPSAHGAAT